MNESELFNKRVEAIEKLIEENTRNLEKIKDMISNLGKELKRDAYKNVEGIIGTFDGSHLVDPNGNKYDVPANYAAKSRLVYGDTIKMIEDNGSTIFKQIQKVERKRSEGVLSKKEGKWVVLTDTGSYRISDVAVDFNQAAMNDEVIVFIPTDNLNAPYATLDRLVNPKAFENKNAPAGNKQPKNSNAPKINVESKPAPAPKAKPAPTPKVVAPAPAPVALPVEADTVTEISLGNPSKPAATPNNVGLDDDDLR